MQSTPILATDVQLQAEAMLRRFLADPEVQASLQMQEQRLRSHPLAQTKDGAARLSASLSARRAPPTTPFVLSGDLWSAAKRNGRIPPQLQ
jgi:hypothetical protein